MEWNVDYKREFERRIRLNNRLEPDIKNRAMVMIHYQHNPIDWINDWCITFDPRRVEPDPRLMPFLLFKRQEEFIIFLQECLKDKQSGLVEKARDIGASWLCCAFAVWLWLFHSGTVVGFGSLKEEGVDQRGNPKALFPKMRQIIEYLPPWMLPAGFDMAKHGTYMRLINPANECAIVGEAGDNIGRGGRTTLYFKDESAHYERPELIEASLGDNTDVQIDISSVNGSANVFYRRRMAGELWMPNKKIEKGKTRVFIFDWRDHPLKTQEWYDLRKKRAEAEGLGHIFAQEVDRDYSGSVDRLIIEPQWVNAAVDAHLKLNITPSGMKRAGQDIADEGGDKNALAIVHGVILQYIEAWGGSAGDAALKSVPKCLESGVSEMYYDCIGVGSGFKNQITNMTIPDSLKIFQWNAANSPIDPEKHIIPKDKQSPTNEDFFANFKAQAWWSLRTRFYKTFMAVTHGEVYEPDELISLPSNVANIHQLKMELSQAVHKYSGSGKVLVDKKPEGSLSPNLADALVMAMLPPKKLSGFFI